MGTNHISGTADGLSCCQLRWTFSVVNWWPSWVTVCHTDCRHLCTARWVRGTASRGSVSVIGDLWIETEETKLLLSQTVKCCTAVRKVSLQMVDNPGINWSPVYFQKARKRPLHFGIRCFKLPYIHWFRFVTRDLLLSYNIFRLILKAHYRSSAQLPPPTKKKLATLMTRF